MRDFLSPCNDMVFKMLFGDKRNIDVLTDFLQSVLTLPPEEYEEVTVVNPFLLQEYLNDKQGSARPTAISGIIEGVST